MVTPTPMDIDAVREYGGEDEGEDWGWKGSQVDQYGIQAVGKVPKGGNGSCHTCGQFCVVFQGVSKQHGRREGGKVKVHFPKELEKVKVKGGRALNPLVKERGKVSR